MVISECLKDLGTPVNVLGYEYLRYAIDLSTKDMSMVRNGLTKQLYPRVAVQYNTTGTRVERCIRSAIETGWFRGNAELQKEIFRYNVKEGRNKPTNAEFIACVADYISLKIETK